MSLDTVGNVIWGALVLIAAIVCLLVPSLRIVVVSIYRRPNRPSVIFRTDDGRYEEMAIGQRIHQEIWLKDHEVVVTGPPRTIHRQPATTFMQKKMSHHLHVGDRERPIIAPDRENVEEAVQHKDEDS